MSQRGAFRGKRTVLLVGGDLCCRVAASLAPENWLTWGLRRHPSDDPHLHWIPADVGAPASLRALPQDISHILYAPAPDRRDLESYRTTYPLGLAHLLDAVRDKSSLRRVVLVSSTVVWPASAAKDDAEWIDEKTPARASNFRSEMILAAEDLLFRILGRRGVTLRLGGIYGPGRTRLIEALRAGRLMAPKGPGHWTNRIHIDDAASACIHLLNLAQPARCYIGTDGQSLGAAVFYDQLADLLGVPRPQQRAMPPSGKRLSNARLVASGWTPRWPDPVAGYRAILGL